MIKSVEDSCSSLLTSSYWFASIPLSLDRLLQSIGGARFRGLEVCLFPSKFGFDIKCYDAEEDVKLSFLVQVTKENCTLSKEFSSVLYSMGVLSHCSVWIRTHHEQYYVLELRFGRILFMGPSVPLKKETGWCLKLSIRNLFENFPLRQKVITSKCGWENRVVLDCLEVTQKFALLHLRPRLVLQVVNNENQAKALLSLNGCRDHLIMSVELLFNINVGWESSSMDSTQIQCSLYVSQENSPRDLMILIVNNCLCKIPEAISTHFRTKLTSLNIFVLKVSCASQQLLLLVPPESGVMWKVTLRNRAKFDIIVKTLIKELSPFRKTQSFFSPKYFETFIQPVRALKQKIDSHVTGLKKQEVQVVRAKRKRQKIPRNEKVVHTKDVTICLHSGKAKVSFVAQVDLKFLVFSFLNETQHFLLFFDQHGLHERIRLEDFVSTFKLANSSCERVLPLMTQEYYLVKQGAKFLKHLGFSFDLQESKLALQRVPEFMGHTFHKKQEILSICKEYQQGLLSMQGSNISTVFSDFMASKACRGAIKFGDSVSEDMATTLFKKVSACKFPFQCAHGRNTLAPFLVRLKKKSDYQLFRMQHGSWTERKQLEIISVR